MSAQAETSTTTTSPGVTEADGATGVKTSAFLETPLEVLRPKHHPRSRFPMWTVSLFAIALVVDIVANLAGGFFPVFSMAFTAVSAVGLAILAMWVEDAFYQWALPQPIWARFALSIAFVVVIPIVTFFFTVASILFLALLHIESALPLLWLVAGLAAAVAALGSLIVLVIDGLIQTLSPVLRTRVMATVLGLGAVAFFISVGSTILVVRFQELLMWLRGASAFQFGYYGNDVTLEEAVTYLDNNTLLVGVGIHLMAAILSLPAVISATGKLASSVVERLEPLGKGFRRLADGDRDIEVEVGGSRDVVELTRRFNEMVTELRLAERMERAFGVYVSDQVLTRIREQHGEAELPAQLRDATVFFADIRGFTAMSEKLTPQQVLSILNRYYERVVAIIDSHQGYLDKFIGDAVVVVFNGPIDQPDHAERAVRCAIEIQEVIKEMNDAGEFPEIGTLKVGAGICSGPMVCGNVGSSQQMEYTVIGDTVNLAARFCGHASAGEVWVNVGCALELDAACLPYVGLEPMLVKGKVAPVVPHRVWPPPASHETIGIRGTRDTVDDGGGLTIGDDDKSASASTTFES